MSNQRACAASGRREGRESGWTRMDNDEMGEACCGNFIKKRSRVWLNQHNDFNLILQLLERKKRIMWLRLRPTIGLS